MLVYFKNMYNLFLVYQKYFLYLHCFKVILKSIIVATIALLDLEIYYLLNL